MKKRLFFAILATLMLISGCGKKEEPIPTPSEDVIRAVIPEEDEADPFYVEMTEKEHVRPIAVMIDNDNDDSRPQIGLEHAYMVYEIVVEGKATRLMALFKNYDLDNVGPVRSSRHYFLDYALEHDAIYAHAGWSPKASKDIANLGVQNINGVGADGSCFFRDNTYDSTWHNLYTGTKQLADYAKNARKYKLETDNGIPSYHKVDTMPETGEDITKISLPYASFYPLSYSYNPETKLYERYIGGTPHASQTGEILSAKNIILYQLKNTTLSDTEDKGRQDLSNIGSGKGYYLTNGKRVPITWSKASREAKTEYSLEDGTPLVLNPGVTYVQIVPNYVTPVYE